MEKLVYQDMVKENTIAFTQKVRDIADRLQINPNWLMLVMKMESNINHRIVNPMGGATGLIQFMPFVAKAMGTTTEALKAMSNVEQLDYVERYFNPYKGKIHSFPDLYLVTFYPAALIQQWPDTRDFPPIVYKYNPGLDVNKDKKINLGEWKALILKKVPASFPKEELYNTKK
jgi:hypothetical protein